MLKSESNAIPTDLATGNLTKVLEPEFKTDTLYRAKAIESDTKLTQLLVVMQFSRLQLRF